MGEPREFRPTVFLYRMLASIFIVEAALIGFAFVKCSESIPGQPVPLINERCPRLGERTSDLFAQSLAVCLSLLVGGGATISALPKLKKKDEPEVPE